VKLFAIGCLALAVAGAAGATVRPSGLQGDVTRGPIAPVCRLDQPCTEPARHVTLMFSRNGRLAGRALTDEAGHYRLRLPPGTYLVRRSVVKGPDWKLSPRRVQIHAGRFVRLDFAIDTGIR
jgi:hypothetical protein